MDLNHLHLSKKLITAVFVFLFTIFGIQAGFASLTCAQGGVCTVGDIGPGGGLVFFVKSEGIFNVSYTEPGFMGRPGQTRTVALTSAQQSALAFDYIEVAPTGRGAGAWGLVSGATTNGTSRLIGSGATNTSNILLTQTADASSNAARFADEYTNNGFSNWYLPAYDELLLMMLRVKLDTFTADNFPIGLWASSDDGDATTATYSALNQLSGNVNRVGGAAGVRAARAFLKSPTPTPTSTPTYVRQSTNLSFAQSLYGSDTLSDPDGELRKTVDQIMAKYGSLIK